MLTSILSIAESVEYHLTDRGSRFLGFSFPCPDIEEFESELHTLKTKFPYASHHCYAWRIVKDKADEYATDAGEPTGTAGMPILNRIKSHDLYNVGIVVVRYFGGTKLGKPGLINAYGTCAEECLVQGTTVMLTAAYHATISYPYNETSDIEALFHRYHIHIDESAYDVAVSQSIFCPVEDFELFLKELDALRDKGVGAESSHEVYYIRT